MSEFLRVNCSEFCGWECTCCATTSASRYDALISDFHSILKAHSLVGYHCTKLTREEIENIRLNGMAPQNSTSLSARIDRLVDLGLLSPEISSHLKDRNQASEDNREGMLWFCFFEPFIAGESGIGRLFRSWGGEALYNLHEGHPITGSAIRSIGIPCIIKASVPISSMVATKFPDGPLARTLLSEQGHRLKIPIEHEGYSTEHVSADNIIEIIEYPSEKFFELTSCRQWHRYAI